MRQVSNLVYFRSLPTETELGFWFVRNPKSVLPRSHRVFEVVRGEGGKLFVDTGEQIAPLENYAGWYFAGPIPEPKDP